MVAPTAFGFNEQAAQDNSFMHSAAKPGEGTELTRAVLREFAGLHHQLTQVAGVKVRMTSMPPCPWGLPSPRVCRITARRTHAPPPRRTAPPPLARAGRLV